MGLKTAEGGPVCLTPFARVHAVLHRPAISKPRLIGERMFHRTPDTEPTHDVKVPAELVPLSVLSLDLEAPSSAGWAAYLTGRGIEVLVDDLGRSSISRVDARQLFDEHRENEARKARQREAAERQAIELDRQWRAQLPSGVPWYEIPPDVLPVVAMTQADRDAQPKRLTPVQEALAGESMTYHC
jgi:hypothetical protein